MSTQKDDYQQLTNASSLIVRSVGVVLLLIMAVLIKLSLTQTEVNRCGTFAPRCGVKDSNISVNGVSAKEIFINNCAQCHAKDMKTKLAGPALGESFARWQYDTTAYFAFIRNSQAMIKKKHPAALKTWAEYRPGTMPSFPNLSDEELKALMAYMER